ncbi:MAG: phosphoglycerate kinase [Solirubrobacteraceae bacterium]
MISLAELDVEGKRVLVRVDFNVPLQDGPDGSQQIADDTRIVAALPTIQQLRSRGARIVLVSHLGRPKGHDPKLSMAPAAARLSQLLGIPVKVAPAVVGEQVLATSEALQPGEVMLLENVRFEPGETKNDPELAHALADLADAYVNDAFGAAHRAHASTEGVAHLLPHAAGLLLQREVEVLGEILKASQRPLVAVIGGAKVADKIGVIDRFLELADVVIVGGAMAFPFLAARGHEVGSSLCDAEDVEHARLLLERARCMDGASFELPVDIVIADGFSAQAQHRELDGVEVPEGWMGLDIGRRTAERYGELIAAAGTVFWNGPMGAFELPPFAQGTKAVAQAVARCKGVTVVGGGDSAAALAKFGLEDAVDHLSTGGGATLELVEGRRLPGVVALEGAGVR